MDRGRLAVSGGDYRPVFAPGGGLVDVGTNDGGAGVQYAENGAVAAEDAARRDSPHRQGEPVLFP